MKLDTTTYDYRLAQEHMNDVLRQVEHERLANVTGHSWTGLRFLHWIISLLLVKETIS